MAACANVVVQNTVQPFAITVTSSGTPDLTSATAAALVVRRQILAAPPAVPPPVTVENWTATINAGATATLLTLTVPLLGATPGVQAVTNPNESILIRPYLTISGQPLECGQASKAPILLLVTPETA